MSRPEFENARARLIIDALRDGHGLRFWDNGILICIVIASSYVSPIRPAWIQDCNYFMNESRIVMRDLLLDRGVLEVAHPWAPTKWPVLRALWQDLDRGWRRMIASKRWA